VNDRPDVARLFVGIPVPVSVSRELARLQPAAAPGVRPIEQRDMHVTLHFLGRAAVAPVRDALRSVNAAAFSLRFGRTGLISTGRRKRVFWAGIESEPLLSALHSKTAGALAAVGFEPEVRTFRPHVTLARLTSKAPANVFASLEGVALVPIGFECRRFALYSSLTRPEGARYEIIDSWPLEPVRPVAETGPR
jgi:2'-5' RNA ligase